jgi:hypothetical protein
MRELARKYVSEVANFKREAKEEGDRSGDGEDEYS